MLRPFGSRAGVRRRRFWVEVREQQLQRIERESDSYRTTMAGRRHETRVDQVREGRTSGPLAESRHAQELAPDRRTRGEKVEERCDCFAPIAGVVSRA
jgi:hypothetical protein